MADHAHRAHGNDGDRDKKKAAKVAAEMQKQVKFDIAKLKAAFKAS